MNPPIISNGQSSTSTSFDTPRRTFICGLCLKPIQLEDSFDFKGCPHFYCTPCIVNFVVSKLQDNADWSLQCPVPTCTGTLDPDYCRPILPSQAFDSWMNAYCVIRSSNLLMVPKAVIVELAKKKKWRKCPKCNYYVEKKDGCTYIKCRHAFCYNCGIAAAADGTHTYHCPSCKK
ncbi:putative transcription factor C2H2 family [Rosa chinensis]|uniref:Putative transcription factor C2H2 family n=1 Tax=Rosa chinensis TaxID=74649 RepID=A0A2P6RL41_ROSCH|nr:putative transcription factor C2H2 family [Rosa chinensis]